MEQDRSPHSLVNVALYRDTPLFRFPQNGDLKTLPALATRVARLPRIRLLRTDGIKPDIPAHLTRPDIIAGRDSVLETAVHSLHTKP
jgi:hypothetical protein